MAKEKETPTEPKEAHVAKKTPLIEPNFIATTIGSIDGHDYEFNTIDVTLPNGKEQVLTVCLKNGSYGGFQMQVL